MNRGFRAVEGAARLHRAALLLALLILPLALTTAARAVPPEGGGGGGAGDPLPSCLDNVNVSFNAWPSTVTLGQNTTLHWNVQASGCNVTQSLNTVAVPRNGSRVEVPTSNRTWYLTVRLGQRSRTFTTSVTVTLPKDSYGRINVTVTSNDQVGLFLQAISSPDSRNAIVNIQNQVTLNLSYWHDIHIYPGVQIVGGRSATNPGPLLFTNTYPEKLFVIGEDENADNVRISGIRLQGADPSVADEDSPDAIGIWINSSLNVEIDNNEIYGWHVAAVQVHDNRDRIDRRNGRGAVRIHDNHLHNNQRIGEGYGVEVDDGAYALVEKNLFCDNRHAIAGDGAFGVGYFFYRNFVCSSGGHHEIVFGIDTQTHQIDMHGQEDLCLFGICVPDYKGVAGEYMDVRYNAITYTAGTALKLRGSPTQRMDVAYNKFAHSDVWGTWYDYGAMQQTDGGDGIHQWGNTFGGRGLTGFGNTCDFDGDGVADTFSANGATWMYASGAAFNGYRYLNTSTLFADEVEFLDVDGDGTCDVRSRLDGRVSLGGRSPLARLARTDILSTNVAAGQLRISHLSGGVITDDVFSSIPPRREVVATGDFDGDGDSDILLRRTEFFPFPDGSGSGRPTTVLFLQDGAVASQADWGFSPLGGGVEAVADFDGDGSSDVLWRDEYGRLKLWYWGVSANVDVRPFNSEDWMVGSDWHVEGAGDFDGDGYPDVVWRHDGGQVAIWLMVGSIYRSEVWPAGTGFGLDWKIQGIGDFDGNGRADLLWRKDDGRLAIWFNGSDSRVAYPSWRNQGNPMDLSWQIQGVSDFNGDGRSDILWRRTTDGLGSIWMMNGGSNVGESPYLFIDSAWQVLGLLPVS